MGQTASSLSLLRLSYAINPIIMNKFTIALISTLVIASCGADSTNSEPKTTPVSTKPKTNVEVLKDLQVDFYEAFQDGLKKGSLSDFAGLCCDDKKEGLIQAQAFLGFLKDEEKASFYNLKELWKSPNNFTVDVSGNTATVSFTSATVERAKNEGLLEGKKGMFAWFSTNMIVGNTWNNTESGWVYCNP
jgi:hypothetical protein